MPMLMTARYVAKLGIVAALAIVGGCALDGGEQGASRPEEPTGEERSAFDPSLFKFAVWVPHDGRDSGGGWQRAIATLHFTDTREELFGKNWTCLVVAELPIRRSYQVITPDRAAELTALAADSAGSTVIHSQPSWPVSVIFCKRLAEGMAGILNHLPGGPTGARITAQ